MGDDPLISILSGRQFPGDPGPGRRKGAREKPKPPAVFDEAAAKILKQTKLTKKQLSKYMEQLSFYILTHTSAEYARSLFEGVSQGNARDMNAFEKIFGMVKGGDGLVINNNLSLNQVNSGSHNRDFDALLREIDREESESKSIDASSVRVIPEGDSRGLE